MFESFSPPITLFYFFVSFSFSGFSRVGESLFPLPSVGISFSFLDEDNKASVGRSVGQARGIGQLARFKLRQVRQLTNQAVSVCGSLESFHTFHAR